MCTYHVTVSGKTTETFVVSEVSALEAEYAAKAMYLDKYPGDDARVTRVTW